MHAAPWAHDDPRHLGYTRNMYAVFIEGYGDLARVRHGGFADPAPRPDEVLVGVRASSINPVDWKVAMGKQRMLTRSRMPRVLGMDVAGEVLAVGRAVRAFQVGDRVFGIAGLFEGKQGSFAERVAIPSKLVGKLPSELSFEQGATLPVAGLTAWALRHAKLTPNHTVFVNGASGGVGSFAIPIAKLYGARVLANCSENNFDYVRSLGADDVVDYRVEDPLQRAPFDVFYDARGNIHARWRRYVRPGGWFFSTEPHPWNFVRTGWTYCMPGRTFRFILTNPKTHELEAFAQFVVTRQLPIPIRSVIALSDVPRALIQSTQGHAQGKTVVRIP
jgi:NADPH:quinone reductase-like Zn-dependent oxidoreductase